MAYGIQLLRETCIDPDKHFETWSNIFHMYPPKWRPPLLLEQNFDIRFLSPEAEEEFRINGIQLRRVSAMFYERDSRIETGGLSEESLDIFYQSQIQQIFAES
jgi:hypothetical protein